MILCYRCKNKKSEDEFILRKDGKRYKLCKVCFDQSIALKGGNKRKKRYRDPDNKECSFCAIILPIINFQRRNDGTYYSSCKDCNKYYWKPKRRAEKALSSGSFTKKEFYDLLKNYEACPMCKIKWENIKLLKNQKNPWTVDHIIPLTPKLGQQKGTNDITNIQPLCYSCNSKKGNKNIKLI